MSEPRPNFICYIHKFSTTSPKKWRKHQLNSKLNHTFHGRTTCKRCNGTVELNNLTVTNLKAMVCPSCGKQNNFIPQLFPVLKGRPIKFPSKEGDLFLRLMEKYGPNNDDPKDPDSA